MKVMGWLFKDSKGMRVEMAEVAAEDGVRWVVRSVDTGAVYLFISPALKMEEALGYATREFHREGMDFRVDFANAVKDD